MPEWLFDFLSGPTIKIAEAIWNSSMRLIIKLVCSTPQKFSTGTWAFVKENLYPWAEGIGLSALNLFFMIAFLKAVSNLHQNITLEMVIEAMVKVVVANVLYLNILNIMTTIFSISSAMAKEVFTIDAPDLKVEDMDIGSALFYQLFGLLFILAAIVCSFLMLWTVYSRYIHYMILPDLEKNDGMLQVAVYQPDRENFGSWYQRHILSCMTGGEKDIQELRNLTSGKTTIVSFPLEEEEEAIKEDFISMGINYSQLPDLHVGDGEIQIIVANADLPKVESWYELYRDDLRKDGITDVPDMKKMSMDNYMQTGQQTEAEYIDTASPELKAVNAKYEGKEKGEIEHQIEAAEYNTMGKESSTAYLRYVNDPAYIPISIDKKTLVEKSSVINKDGLDRYNQFACRIPGTYGKNEKQLVIPETQVFETQKGSYIAFLNKEEPVFVFNVRTKQVDHEMRKLTGEEFAKQYFDKVDRPSERKVTSLQKYKEKGKDLSDLKIKMPDPPIRSK